MRWFSRIVSLLVILAGAGLGVWFYLDNMQPVSLVFFSYPVNGIPQALWLLAFFAAGTALGLSVSAIQALRHQMHLQILRRQLKAAKQKTLVRTAS